MTHSRTVLIVDDEPNNLNLLSRYVEREGHKTILVNGGLEALQALADNDVDLILLDWMMPDLSGIDVLRAVRDEQSASTLPVIMCTALDDNDHIAAALSEGANDFITKPIDRTILNARMSSQLQRKAAMTELEVINKDLEAVIAERTKALIGANDNIRDDISLDDKQMIGAVLQAVVDMDLVALKTLQSAALDGLAVLSLNDEDICMGRVSGDV
ncbi:MAG: response regulator transcription factor [Hyphomonas sp.]